MGVTAQRLCKGIDQHREATLQEPPALIFENRPRTRVGSVDHARLGSLDI